MALAGRVESCFLSDAIGSEPDLRVRQYAALETPHGGHAAANLMPVVAANRIGEETVEPCEEKRRTAFGACLRIVFLTDETGEI